MRTNGRAIAIGALLASAALGGRANPAAAENEKYEAKWIWIGWWCSGPCPANANCCVVLDQ